MHISKPTRFLAPPLLMIVILVCGRSVFVAQTTPKINAPDAVLHDQPFNVTVTGMAPNTPYTMRFEFCSRAGTIWRSDNVFKSDADGTVDLSRDAPVSGTYTGVDKTGPLWSMSNTKEHSGDASIFDNDEHSVAVIQLRDGEKSIAQRSVVISYRDIGVSTVEVRGPIVGTFNSPPVKGRAPALIVLGGSEGALNRPLAALIASHGFPSLALAYFGYEKLPADLEKIPVETIDRAVEWLAKQPGVDPNRIVVLGGSKGAELALLSASLNKSIAGVVAYAPSSVIYEGIGNSPGHVSSWTYKGVELPFAPYVHNDTYSKSRRLIDLYEPTFAAAPPESRIAVENIAGPIMLISGKDDALWPSSRMADEMAGRLKSKGFKFEVTNLQFDDVGHHCAGIPLRPTADSVRLGGSARSIAHANVEAWHRIVSFLTVLKQNRPS